MKKIIAKSLIVLFLALGVGTIPSNFLSFGESSVIEKAEAAVYVKGYTRKDGTYVSPHYRSDPDSSVTNNWSYKGNVNPYTGAVGTKTYYDREGANSTGNTQIYQKKTPTCPLMAYYDKDSASCLCYDGYMAKGGQCVSKYQVCTDTYGIMSYYDSENDTCKCYTGYRFNKANNLCISYDAFCVESFGENAEYRYLDDSCYCKNGYVFDKSSNQCVKPEPVNVCGKNSYSDTATTCKCLNGYKWEDYADPDNLNCKKK